MTHRCAKCRCNLPLSAFAVRIRSGAAYSDCYCHDCRAAYKRQWDAAHRDHRREWAKRRAVAS